MINDLILSKLEKIENLLSIQKNVLNVDELSIFTGLSKSTIYKLTSKGGIKFYRQAKHLYFKKDEVEAWLMERPLKTAEEIETEAATIVTLGRNRGAK